MPLTPIRETIDIEALLVRAYREKKVDRLPANPRRLLGIRGPALPGASAFARGDRVDTSSWGATATAEARKIMARLTSAGDGLLAAHDLVLSLDDYFAEYQDEADCAFTLWTKAGALDAGQWIEEEQYGGLVTIQAAEVRREAGPDGERVHVAPIAGTRQRRLHKIVVAPLLVIAGRAGEPPYVSPIVVTRERKIYCQRSRRTIGTEPVYETPLATVVRERAEYAAWHAALTAIAAQLAEVDGLTIAAPAAPPRPWESEVAAVA